MDRLVKVWQVGKISYSNGLKLQRCLANLHSKDSQVNNTLLCIEHPPVYTTGIRTKLYSEIEENTLKSKGAEFFRTDRGGLITFHGPGQLVVYPILNLKHFKPSIKWYVCHIEKTIIELCKKFDLEAETSPHTGVWIKNNKIYPGLITSYHVALRGKGVTSLSKELDRVVTIEEVLPKFLDSFSDVFNCNYVDFPKDEADDIFKIVK
ncbi:hypothetical protein NQ314_011843 [Rhamnusium bicolor]|uniref:lipoyl(octanoyl) transferase n=1 Tax=Rhamnusium bicolor TaxID=1586634 RepID=A0AAV8XG64_9CUCU|nr:hypothetical protein NQ314_011843 [Rhamnusium bicolor]